MSMTSPLSPSAQSSPKHPFACVRCAVRKVRCNKELPCKTCVRHNEDCVFRPPNPSKRRQKLQREQLLSDRLVRYESLLHANGIDLAHIADAATDPEATKSVEPLAQLHTPVSPQTEPQTTVFQPHLLFGQNGAKLVDK